MINTPPRWNILCTEYSSRRTKKHPVAWLVSWSLQKTKEMKSRTKNTKRKTQILGQKNQRNKIKSLGLVFLILKRIVYSEVGSLL
jgi:hypothetical protein